MQEDPTTDNSFITIESTSTIAGSVTIVILFVNTLPIAFPTLNKFRLKIGFIVSGITAFFGTFMLNYPDSASFSDPTRWFTFIVNTLLIFSAAIGSNQFFAHNNPPPKNPSPPTRTPQPTTLGGRKAVDNSSNKKFFKSWLDGETS